MQTTMRIEGFASPAPALLDYRYSSQENSHANIQQDRASLRLDSYTSAQSTSTNSCLAFSLLSFTFTTLVDAWSFGSIRLHVKYRTTKTQLKRETIYDDHLNLQATTSVFD
jgi:hypothetical protein